MKLNLPPQPPKSSLPTEPGIYRDAYGLPWILGGSVVMDLIEGPDGSMYAGATREELTWRFGDEQHELDEVEGFGPFTLLTDGKPHVAADLSFRHMGHRFRSLQYPNKNKTAKPKAYSKRLDNGAVIYTAEPREWVLGDLNWFHNGNIVVNGGSFYLRPDTEVVILDA